MRSSPSAHLLRCEALDTLARCYQMQGMVQQQWDAYTRGLTVCREGTQSKDRCSVRGSSCRGIAVLPVMLRGAGSCCRPRSSRCCFCSLLAGK